MWSKWEIFCYVSFSSVEIVLPYSYWFLSYLLTSVIPVDKVFIALSKILFVSLAEKWAYCETIWSLSVSFSVCWRWSSSMAIRCYKFLAGRKHFTVDTKVLVQTSHPILWILRDSPSEGRHLLAPCYGIGFLWALMSRYTVGNGVNEV